MINDKIKYLRQNKGISQSMLAKEIGVSQKAIDFWEKGTNEPKSSYIIKLSDFYQVSTDYLLDRETEDGRIIIQEPELPSDEKALLNNYRNLPNELKSMTQEYVKTLNNLNNEFYKNELNRKA